MVKYWEISLKNVFGDGRKDSITDSHVKHNIKLFLNSCCENILKSIISKMSARARRVPNYKTRIILALRASARQRALLEKIDDARASHGAHARQGARSHPYLIH